MGSFSATGIDAAILNFNELANLPDSVVDKMAEAGANVIAKNVRAKGEVMGVHRTGVTLGSLQAAAPKKTGDGVAVRVIFKGNRGDRKNKTSNSEVAFVNNFGKRGQPPRPFFTTGVAESEGQAVKAAEEIYDNFIKSKNL